VIRASPATNPKTTIIVIPTKDQIQSPTTDPTYMPAPTPAPFSDAQSFFNSLSSEIQIHKPPEFDGDWQKAENFVLCCEEYMLVNRRFYGYDLTKVIFVLSYCTTGLAAEWAAEKRRTYAETMVYPSYKDFRAELLKNFFVQDTVIRTRATDDIHALRQTESVMEYIIRFKILASRAGITEESAKIQCFMNGLNDRLRSRIQEMQTVPDTIEGWYDAAAQFEQSYERDERISAFEKNNKMRSSESASQTATRMSGSGTVSASNTLEEAVYAIRAIMEGLKDDSDRNAVVRILEQDFRKGER
jgi:hypothetical protein